MANDTQKHLSRRRFMSYSLGLGGLYLFDPKKFLQAQNTCPPTRPDIEGPYYRAGAPDRYVIGDATLVIFGYVLGTRCEPIPGALVDVWQASPDGVYDLKTEDYNYRARVYSDENGFYYYYTDIPGLYPQRPIRHIHYRVSAEGYRMLTTQ